MPTGVEVGNGARVAATSKDVHARARSPRPASSSTWRSKGDGFFEVQQPDGTIAYTRDGSFKLNAQGQVVTADGLPVLSGFQAGPAGTTAVDISQTGHVTDDRTERHHDLPVDARPVRQPGRPAEPGRQSLCRDHASGTPADRPARQNGFGSILQGYLEGSNVNIVEEMVNLITAQRAYEINSKSVQASDQMLQNVANMKQ